MEIQKIDEQEIQNPIDKTIQRTNKLNTKKTNTRLIFLFLQLTNLEKEEYIQDLVSKKIFPYQVAYYQYEIDIFATATKLGFTVLKEKHLVYDSVLYTTKNKRVIAYNPKNPIQKIKIAIAYCLGTYYLEQNKLEQNGQLNDEQEFELYEPCYLDGDPNIKLNENALQFAMYTLINQKKLEEFLQQNEQHFDNKEILLQKIYKAFNLSTQYISNCMQTFLLKLSSQCIQQTLDYALKMDKLNKKQHKSSKNLGSTTKNNSKINNLQEAETNEDYENKINSPQAPNLSQEERIHKNNQSVANIVQSLQDISASSQELSEVKNTTYKRTYNAVQNEPDKNEFDELISKIIENALPFSTTYAERETVI